MIDDMQVYIANLGKYNEGELVGDWFSFPLDEEVIAERIGLNAEYLCLSIWESCYSECISERNLIICKLSF